MKLTIGSYEIESVSDTQTLNEIVDSDEMNERASMPMNSIYHVS